MLENEQNTDHSDQNVASQAEVETPAVAPKKRTRKAPAKKAAAAPDPDATTGSAQEQAPDESTAEPTKKPVRKRASRAKKVVETPPTDSPDPSSTMSVSTTAPDSPDTSGSTDSTPVEAPPARKRSSRAKKKAEGDAQAATPSDSGGQVDSAVEPVAAAGGLIFQTPDTAAQAPAEPAKTPRKRARKKPAAGESAPVSEGTDGPGGAASLVDSKDWLGTDSDDESDAGSGGGSDSGSRSESSEDSGDSDGPKRRRRRGGRRRRKSGDGESTNGEGDQSQGSNDTAAESGDNQKPSGSEGGAEPVEDTQDSGGDAEGSETGSRRRRRRRRTGEDGGEGDDRPARSSGRARKPRSPEDEITAVTGSTRLEAKKQRRREGREAGRRRAPIVSEAEFLARRESVDRVMAIRQRDDVTQIAVLEDKVLVEHYVARDSQTSLIGNVYLGRVQNVLPSMEAAFIDIGKGRNAVLYAGEVNWSALGHKDGAPRKIESVLSSGQPVLVQVTKDPIGHKGARLTSQVSLAGRFLVYVPDGTTSGISRKLPDTERNRLKTLLKEIVPDSAGVIVRTAAEGATEDELTQDVERLKARWEDIEKKAGAKSAGAQLLYGEPDLTLKVVRDLFTEDFAKLTVEGAEAWETVQNYVSHVAPDLEERLDRYEPSEHNNVGLFSALRIEEQIHKGLDRKVWLPSGGSLVIDRTEAMTVVDVNTGKFTGSGGNLEETVTKNNLEAAEEVVRQLRLRDIGGIIVFDFIDMVLESNRDLVLRRLVECLGRDRTRHQVAEVTSLGLVQMTRKRIGTGLLEAFSQQCDHCAGRGVVVQDAPVEPKRIDDGPRGGNARKGRGRGRGDGNDGNGGNGGGGNGNGNQQSGAGSSKSAVPSPRDVAAMARDSADRHPVEAADSLDNADATAVPGAPAPTASTPASQEQPVDVAVTSTQPEEAGPNEPTEPQEQVSGQEEPAPHEAAQQEPAQQEPAQQEPAQQEPAQPKPAQPEPAQQEPAHQEPVEVPAPAPAVSTAPKVVTRTRRRAASRPAGPPSSQAAVDLTPVAPAVPADSEVDKDVDNGANNGSSPEAGGAADVPGVDEPVIEHVPVKKRGTRKR